MLFSDGCTPLCSAKLQEEARIKEAAAQKLKQETEDKIKQMVSKKRPANAVKRDFFGRVVSDAAVKTQRSLLRYCAASINCVPRQLEWGDPGRAVDVRSFGGLLEVLRAPDYGTLLDGGGR